MNLENKVQKYINHLYDKGVRGTSDDNHGMSVYDEENIAYNLIQSTLPGDLPPLDSVFNNVEFLDCLAAYMESADAMDGICFIDEIVAKVTQYYRPQIKQLMDEVHARSQQSGVAGDQ